MVVVVLLEIPVRSANRVRINKMGDQGGSSVRKEIYTYEAPWSIYAMGWCQKLDPEARYRLAVGSFTEEYNNKIQVGPMFRMHRL